MPLYILKKKSSHLTPTCDFLLQHVYTKTKLFTEKEIPMKPRGVFKTTMQDLKRNISKRRESKTHPFPSQQPAEPEFSTVLDVSLSTQNPMLYPIMQ